MQLALFVPALATLLVAVVFFPLTLKIFSVLLFVPLCYASYIDMERMEIPDTVSIGLFPLGAVCLMVQTPDLLPHRLLSAILVLLLMASFSRIFLMLRGKEGLGFGDVKLIASATVWIGLPNLPLMVFLAAVFGLLASFYNFAMRKQHQHNAHMAFGPYLALSIWLVWVFMSLGLSETFILGLSR